MAVPNAANVPVAGNMKPTLSFCGVCAIAIGTVNVMAVAITARRESFEIFMRFVSWGVAIKDRFFICGLGFYQRE
jgi:hypothetical protein